MSIGSDQDRSGSKEEDSTGATLPVMAEEDVIKRSNVLRFMNN